MADFYHKKTRPVKIRYAQPFNEITIYFKPLGILHFLENLEDFELLSTKEKIPSPKYLDEMSKVLQMNNHRCKIHALETYWLSLLKNKDLGVLESILQDLEQGLKVTEIANRWGNSRQYLHNSSLNIPEGPHHNIKRYTDSKKWSVNTKGSTETLSKDNIKPVNY